MFSLKDRFSRWIKKSFCPRRGHPVRRVAQTLRLELLETRAVPATYIWGGGGNGLWSNGELWRFPNGNVAHAVPGPNDLVRFPNAFTDNCTIDSTNVTEVGNVQFDGYSKHLTLNTDLLVDGTGLGGTASWMKTATPTPNDYTIGGKGNISVAIGGTFTWYGGTFAGTGSLVVNPGATLNIPSGTDGVGDARLAGRQLYVWGALPFLDAGTINFTTGQMFCQNDPISGNPSSITNAGRFNISGTATRIATGNPTTFTNETGGRVVVAVGGAFTIGTTFNNKSSAVGYGVQLTTGTLNLTGGGTSEGTWGIGANQQIRFQPSGVAGAPMPQFQWNSGTQFFSPVPDVTHGGWVYIAGASVTIAAGATTEMNARLAFVGGSLLAGGPGGATLHMMREFHWTGGTAAGSGTISLDPGSFMLVYGAGGPAPVLSGGRSATTEPSDSAERIGILPPLRGSISTWVTVARLRTVLVA